MKRSRFSQLLSAAFLSVAALGVCIGMSAVLSSCGGGGDSAGSITVREFMSGQKELLFGNTLRIRCENTLKLYNYTTGSLIMNTSGTDFQGVQILASNAENDLDKAPTRLELVLPGNCDNISEDPDWLAFWFGASSSTDNMTFYNKTENEGEGDNEGDNEEGNNEEVPIKISGNKMVFALEISGSNGSYTIEEPQLVQAHDEDDGWGNPMVSEGFTGRVQVLPAGYLD